MSANAVQRAGLKQLRAARWALLHELESRRDPELEVALAAVEDRLCALLAARRREEADS